MKLPIWLAAAALAASAQSPEDVAAGGRIYRSHCAECHGLKGEGGRGPNLTTGEFLHGSSDQALARTIQRGIPGTEMPGIYHEGRQVAQVVAFVRSLSGTAAPVPVRGDPSKGEALYRKHGCAVCHMVNGDGGRLGPDLSYIGSARMPADLRESILRPEARVAAPWFPAEAVTKDGKTISGYRLNEDGWSVQMIDSGERLLSLDRRELAKFQVHRNQTRMPAYAGKLNETELDDIVAWLSSLRRKVREQ
jgi:putative heme-binding domain-containing protein